MFHYNQICRKNKYQILIDTIVIFYKQNMKNPRITFLLKLYGNLKYELSL